MRVCMYVCMHAIGANVSIYLYVRMYVCTYAHMHVCMYACNRCNVSIYLCMNMYVEYVCVRMYVCMYACLRYARKCIYLSVYKYVC